MSKLSGDQMAILAPEVIEKAGVGFNRAEQAVGTGAFIMKSREDQVNVEYVRNLNYWKPGLPYLDGVRVVRFDDGNTAYASFAGKQVDVTLLPGTRVKEYLSQQGPTYSPDWYKHDGILTQIVPNTKIAPFGDARVTRALRLMVDHEEWLGWAQDFYGRGRYGSIFCTALDAWELSHEEYSRLLEWKQPKDEATKEALSLLAAAGFNKDNPLRFEFTGQAGNTGFAEPAVTLMQAQWSWLGQGVVNARIKLLEPQAYQQARAGRDYTYGYFGNAATVIEPDLFLNQIYRSNANRNYWNWGDATLDQMIDKQHTIFDIPQRKAVVRDIILYMADHHPGVICSYLYFLDGVNPRVNGLAPEFYFYGRQWENVWLDI